MQLRQSMAISHLAFSFFFSLSLFFLLIYISDIFIS
jgi:hypothetical protein